MRIYTKVIFDPKTLKPIGGAFYESDEPVALCKSDPNSGYNKQMAAIAAQQAAMSKEFMEFWRTYEKPAAKEFIAQARKGVDVGEEQARAKAEFQKSWQSSQEMEARQMGRYGIDPTSGRGRALARKGTYERARGLAAVSGQARRYAEGESFRRLGMAGGYGG